MKVKNAGIYRALDNPQQWRFKSPKPDKWRINIWVLMQRRRKATKASNLRCDLVI